VGFCQQSLGCMMQRVSRGVVGNQAPPLRLATAAAALAARRLGGSAPADQQPSAHLEVHRFALNAVCQVGAAPACPHTQLLVPPAVGTIRGVSTEGRCSTISMRGCERRHLGRRRQRDLLHKPSDCGQPLRPAPYAADCWWLYRGPSKDLAITAPTRGCRRRACCCWGRRRGSRTR
jgi:hypothetical protein